MSSFETGVKKALADTSKVQRLIGTYVSNDGVRGTVDVGGGRIPADFCGYVPHVNESVWVLFVNGTATILGPTKMRSGIGTVASAPSGNRVAVTTDGGTETVPYASGLSLSVGQVVRLGAWNDGGFVYAVMSTTPVFQAPPANTGGGQTNFSQTFVARDSGSYRGGNGWWTGEVWSSDNNTGAWFYGSSIADTIPNTATITRVQLYIAARQIQYAGPNFGAHGSAGKPGGNISFGTGTQSVGIYNGWVDLPGFIGNYLRDNAGGIGIDHGGYSIMKSIQQDASSGAVAISWRT